MPLVVLVVVVAMWGGGGIGTELGARYVWGETEVGGAAARVSGPWTMHAWRVEGTLRVG